MPTAINQPSKLPSVPSWIRKLPDWVHQLGNEVSVNPVAGVTLPKGKPIYHATRAAFENFDAKKGSSSQWLNRLIHFAENPDDAVSVAMEPREFRGVGTKGMRVIPTQSSKDLNLIDYMNSRYPSEDRDKLLEAARRLYKRDVTKNMSGAFVNDPRVMREAGFDGIRYFDTGPSYGLLDDTPLTTPWGTPLTSIGGKK